MKQYVILLTGFLFFGLIACKKENVTNEQLHDITSVTGSATGTVNTDVILMVTYPYINGCDFIERFEESKEGNVITVKGITKPVGKDVVCTQDVGTRTIEYKFKASTAGTYELRFRKLDNTTVNHTIVIQ